MNHARTEHMPAVPAAEPAAQWPQLPPYSPPTPEPRPSRFWRAVILMFAVPIALLLCMFVVAAGVGLVEAVAGHVAVTAPSSPLDTPAGPTAAPQPRTTPAPAERPASGRACWVEDKSDGNPPERICGDVKLAPVDAHDFAPYPGGPSA